VSATLVKTTHARLGREMKKRIKLMAHAPLQLKPVADTTNPNVDLTDPKLFMIAVKNDVSFKSFEKLLTKPIHRGCYSGSAVSVKFH
jgi:hypothetical protein